MPSSKWRRTFRAVFTQPDPRAHALLLRDSQTVTRIHFLHAAAHLGLFAELKSPDSAAALEQRLGVKRPQQFRLFLDLGVALGELSRRGDAYALKGARARALAGRNGSVLRALLDEQLGYHGSVYQHLPERLQGAELGDYLTETAAVVAESSRIAEPVVSAYVREAVAEAPGAGADGPRVLDAGCGSGVYLRAAAHRPGTTGTGIDLREASVDMTRRNLAEWGLADRFTVRQGDVRDAGPDGPYDVVLLLNNIYYFAPEERAGIFRTLREALRDGGTLVLVSMFHGQSPTGLNLDLVLACTQGCYALPTPEELRPELREAGFADVRVDQLVAGQDLLALRAR
ncbi:cyclopropane-fatty-acyl-phospholipid synthase family protein [Streptomyces sp. JJ36]|uniref:SAM-dependent methyltransferase n=1 Tax=Streptomyces sp. JJ36 TaxID=2736645 RepID=UPI001F1CFD5F|nr:class I SAM-dependent methyltransferase [Streptomyces sp. JJ36]MCF6524482.1 methyltransferase domain-containing protein [Streptomyces sp. JJ36]